MEYTNDYVKAASESINAAMIKKGYTSKTIIPVYKETFNRSISAATLSNLLNGHENVSLTVYANLAQLLEIDLFQILSGVYKEQNIIEEDDEFTNIFVRNIFNERHTFIIDAEDPVFDGYEGTYNTYFYQTISGKEELLHGILTFDKSKNGFFNVHFSLYSGDYDEQGNNITKNYEGYLVYSIKTQVVSCLLLSAKVGEICLINFRYIPINHNKLVCRMALAITSSAGTPRLPTVHRLYFTRMELSEEELTKLRGQLLMNSSSIIVSRENLKNFIKETKLPVFFRNTLENILEQENYIKINETALFENATSHPTTEEIEALFQLRNISEEVRYNKISSRTDEYTFKLYNEKKQNGAYGTIRQNK